jgi:hypothetical protein
VQISATKVDETLPICSRMVPKKPVQAGLYDTVQEVMTMMVRSNKDKGPTN